MEKQTTLDGWYHSEEDGDFLELFALFECNNSKMSFIKYNYGWVYCQRPTLYSYRKFQKLTPELESKLKLIKAKLL